MHAFLRRSALALAVGGGVMMAACSHDDSSHRRMAADDDGAVWFDGNGDRVSRAEMNRGRTDDWYASGDEQAEAKRQRDQRMHERDRDSDVKRMERQSQNFEPGRDH
jgi:hypothetical protein